MSQPNIIHYILIARMVKPTSKTTKTIQARLGSLPKAGTTGKKKLASSKTCLLPSATNKRRDNFLHPMSLILLLPVMTKTLILLLTKMLMLPSLLPEHCYPCLYPGNMLSQWRGWIWSSEWPNLFRGLVRWVQDAIRGYIIIPKWLPYWTLQSSPGRSRPMHNVCHCFIHSL